MKPIKIEITEEALKCIIESLIMAKNRKQEVINLLGFFSKGIGITVNHKEELEDLKYMDMLIRNFLNIYKNNYPDGYKEMLKYDNNK